MMFINIYQKIFNLMISIFFKKFNYKIFLKYIIILNVKLIGMKLMKKCFKYKTN